MTIKYIQRAQYKGKKIRDGAWTRDLRWDTKVTGFALRLLPSGVKSFVVVYRDAKYAKRLKTIGRVGIVSLTQARARAKKIIADEHARRYK